MIWFAQALQWLLFLSPNNFNAWYRAVTLEVLVGLGIGKLYCSQCGNLPLVSPLNLSSKQYKYQKETNTMQRTTHRTHIVALFTGASSRREAQRVWFIQGSVHIHFCCLVPGAAEVSCATPPPHNWCTAGLSYQLCTINSSIHGCFMGISLAENAITNHKVCSHYLSEP